MTTERCGLFSASVLMVLSTIWELVRNPRRDDLSPILLDWNPIYYGPSSVESFDDEVLARSA